MFCVFLFSTPASHSPLVLFGTSCTSSPAQWSASRVSPQSCQSHESLWGSWFSCIPSGVQRSPLAVAVTGCPWQPCGMVPWTDYLRLPGTIWLLQGGETDPIPGGLWSSVATGALWAQRTYAATGDNVSGILYMVGQENNSTKSCRLICGRTRSLSWKSLCPRSWDNDDFITPIVN